MSNKKYITLENLQTYRQEDKAELDAALLLKQDALVSGTNIKTVNGNSILGAGDLDVTPDVIADLPLTAAEATALLAAIGSNLNASIQLSNWSALTDLSATATIRLHDADNTLIFYFTRSIGVGGNDPMQMWLCYTSMDDVSLFVTITNGLLQLGQLEVIALPGEAYDSTQTYNPGDFIRDNNGHILRCAFATTGTFNADDWVDYTEGFDAAPMTHAYALDVLNAYLTTSVAARYIQGHAYHVGDLVTFTPDGGHLLRCVRDTVAPHAFNLNDWELVTIPGLIGDAVAGIVADRTSTALLTVSSADWAVLKTNHYLAASAASFPDGEEGRYKITIDGTDHLVRVSRNSTSQAKALFMVDEEDQQAGMVYHYELTMFIQVVSGGSTRAILRCATIFSEAAA